MSEDTLPTAQSQDGSSSENSPFVVPQINLPKGGGAIRGIGEKFAANAATGTGSLTVPIALSSGRSGFGPQLALSYDSGSGNGAFGIGWRLSLPSITRKTDKGLPRYHEGEESDVFILSGTEDLVPVLEKDAHGRWVHDEFEREGYQVKRYRPRIEGLFARIERWTRIDDGDVHWRSISKDNILTVYGRTCESRIFDPHDHRHVFSWLICESYDDKGNAIVYDYVAENDSGVDLAQANEANRSRTANRYLKRIRYGNRKPLLLDVNLPSFRHSHLHVPGLATADWMFEAVLDYGDGHYSQAAPDGDGWIWAQATPTIGPGCHWPVRKDPFSGYRSGFEVRTYRLCRRVLMFHHFPEELGTDDYLVRSTEFEYREKPIGSFISRAIQSGYTRHPDGRYLKKSLPAMDLTYSSSPLEDPSFTGYHVREADSENLRGGIDGQNYKWLDLNGEGISGVLMEQGDSWFYKPNAGGGRFRPLELVAPRPSLAALRQGKQQLLDVAGNGNLDLVQLSSSVPGFYERTFDEGWGDFRSFRSFPVCDWNDPNLRFVDITGDGIADVLITEDDAFTWHRSLLNGGFGDAVRVPVPHDEREGPHVVFADGTQSIYLADMSGDGLSDLVRVRNGEVCYWPNLGYGKFGRKVTMDNSPWFDDPDLFNQNRIKLADTDGSGTTDLLYLGADGIKVLLNQSGNGWSGARVLQPFAAASDQTFVSVVDFLGRGTACLLWSSSLPADEDRSLRYVDLMCGQKPHLLVSICNNLGAETRIEYASSTEFYLADKAAGTPWVTRLPFPVHVVKRVETYDYLSRNRFVTSYTYHHGFFDGVEREFRGFGCVEQLDTEEFGSFTASGTFPAASNEHASFNVPPVLMKTWYHTGVFIGNGRVSRHLSHEYYREPHESSEMLLDDTILPSGLTPEEAREACRSLKGSMLRQEVYALDGTQKSSRPYTASESSFTIKPLQPRLWNRHAVFFTHAREALTLSYERKLYNFDGVDRGDPRAAHTLTLGVDEYGNVLKAASIGYPRRFPDHFGLPHGPDRHKQQQLFLTLTESDYTNAVGERHGYRTPLPSETRIYELYNLQPEAQCYGVTNLFRFEETQRKVAAASDGRHDLPYEQMNGTGAFGGEPCRRLFQRARTTYRSDDLERLLPVGQLELLALPGSVYQLALTPGVIRGVYRRKLHDRLPEDLLPDPGAVLHEGGYVDLDRDGHWWIPSGRIFYSADPHESSASELAYAQQHFFTPRRYRDQFGNLTVVAFDAHDLALVRTRDAAGNTITSLTDYRVLSPKLVTDPNQNRTAAAFDALGMLSGTAVMGKEADGQGDSLHGFVSDLSERTIIEHTHHPLSNPHDILRGASTRFVCDLFAFARTRNDPHPQPAVTCVLSRETHLSDLSPGQRTKIQQSFSYSDGFGRIAQKKGQAAPGPLEPSGPEVNPRWIGSGWTIFNNKGKPVRQYEPFFSATHRFEFADIVGVSATLFYDPIGRVIATLHPEHTYEKVVFDPWQQATWDVNDTVLERDPAEDPDVGDFFRRLPHDDYLPTWYEQRRNGALGRKAKEAAERAALHANTPRTAYLDTLARTFLTVDISRGERDGTITEQRIVTSFELDVEGQQLSVVDALGRRVMTYTYDLVTNRIHQSSADAGDRWNLIDIAKKPLRTWDSRGYSFRYEYDDLRRQTALLFRREHNGEKLVERTVYGEGQLNDLTRNLRGKMFQSRDGAGVAESDAYDFKGNLLRGSRQLLPDYHDDPDWVGSPDLEPRIFTTSTTYDALNRVVTLTAPDASVTRLGYNEASLLEGVDVNLRGAETATPFVTNITYNPKAQRELIAFGNGARTRYAYDPFTFRLIHLETTRTTDHAVLQDLKYTYDPIGNVTSITDHAQQTVYFDNQVVSASNDYLYDAIYRLIEAHGREHIGLLARPELDWNDEPRMNQSLPGDGLAMRLYQEDYRYDEAGNILELIHHAVNGGWRRHYEYPGSSNRLRRTRVGELEEQYSYDANGNIVRMPHLPLMSWDFRNQLHITREQAVNRGEGQRTFYVYDASGQRVRKVTERADGSKAHERIYLGGFEIYREYSRSTVTLERETLHVMDDKRRIVLVETKTIDVEAQADHLPHVVMRYQFTNHLDSSSLELDEGAAIISYEEYYPYGTTSYEAVRKRVEASPKRYRYTGKERDEETGLYYNGARYYVSWLGRWTACDPKGLTRGTNLFLYCSDNPVGLCDPNGTSDGPTPAEAEAGACLIDPSAEADINFTSGGQMSRVAMAPHVDEFVAVKGDLAGGVAGSPSDASNKWFLDPKTNVQSKSNFITSAPENPRPNVSLASSPEEAANRIITGRFSEVDELRALADDAAARTSPGLRTNSTLRASMKADRAVRGALESVGVNPDTLVLENPPGVSQFPQTGTVNLSPADANINAATGEVVPGPATNSAMAQYQARRAAMTAPEPEPAVSGLRTGLRVGGYALAAAGTAYAGYQFSQDIAEGNWTGAALNGTAFAGGGLALGGAAVGSTTLVMAGTVLAAPAAVIGAAAGGVAIGTYINNHTGISDTAMEGGEWVEAHTGSTTLGAIGAAGTAIITSPYYAGEALGGALESAGDWLGDKIYDWLH